MNDHSSWFPPVSRMDHEQLTAAGIALANAVDGVLPPATSYLVVAFDRNTRRPLITSNADMGILSDCLRHIVASLDDPRAQVVMLHEPPGEGQGGQ